MTPVQCEAPKTLVPLIGLISMLGPFSIDTYLPSFPAMAEALGADLAAIAQTLGSYLIAFAFATLIWGPVSDSFGRRRVLLISLLLYAGASLGCALAGDLPALILWRILQGVTACGGVVIGRAVVRDLYQGPQAQRAMAHTRRLSEVNADDFDAVVLPGCSRSSTPPCTSASTWGSTSSSAGARCSIFSPCSDYSPQRRPPGCCLKPIPGRPASRSIRPRCCAPTAGRYAIPASSPWWLRCR